MLLICILFLSFRLHAEDLAFLLGMQQKDLRKLCARLREERLIASHTRAEIRDGATRPVNREYYYIPLHPVIDAIKFKVSKLTGTIKAQYTPSEERKEYMCVRCGAEWTELDVLSLFSEEEGFLCQSCGAVLYPTEDVKGSDGIDRTGHEKNSKLMAQLDKMLKLLKQIDSTEIPPNDFDTAWDHKVDVIRNNQTNPTRAAIAVPSRKQEAIRGNTKTDSSALEISLSSTEEKSAADQADEAARKAAVEKQNALPVWHTHSTVTTTAGNVDETTTSVKTEQQQDNNAIKSELKEEAAEEEEQKPNIGEEQKPSVESLDDKVAAYYDEIAKEQAREAQEDATTPDDDDEEEEEEEEFEGEFEDVGAVSGSATSTGTGTPAVGTAGAGPPPTSNPISGSTAETTATSASEEQQQQGDSTNIKRELDVDSTTTSTNVSAAQAASASPSNNTSVGNGDGEPATKKIKIEEEPSQVKKEDEESDEDEEFEDV